MLLREATHFVERDTCRWIGHILEELALDHLLSRKVENAVTPLLTYVTAIVLLAYLPIERGGEVVENPFLFQVLIKDKFWVEDLPCEDQVVIVRELTALPILLAVHLCDLGLVVARCECIHYLLQCEPVFKEFLRSFDYLKSV